jgi:hypothetical protein
MRRRLLATSMLLTIACGIGCSLVLDYTDYSKNADCPHAALPPKPSIASTPGGSSFDVAFSYITVEGKDRNGKPISIGFDIDNACTCSGAGPTCKATASTKADQQCDSFGNGTDEAINRVFGQIKSFLPQFSDDGLNKNLTAGDFGLLMRIDSYNGLTNDPDVAVTFVNGVGLTTGSGPPTFKNDSWKVEGTAQGTPLYVANGWVNDGVLAADFSQNRPPMSLRWRVPPLAVVDGGPSVVTARLTFTEARISARIVNSNGKVALTDGQLGGVVTFDDGIAIVRSFGCDPALTTNGKATLCTFADLPDNDTHACNVLSFAMGFEAVPATIATFVPVNEPAPCADAGTVPDCTQ